jgi:hypothetical protein
MERCPLRLVSTVEELLGKTSSGSGLENREYGSGDPIICPQKLALISPTNGGRSIGIVRTRTQAMEFISIFLKKLPIQRKLRHLDIVRCR